MLLRGFFDAALLSILREPWSQFSPHLFWDIICKSHWSCAAATNSSVNERGGGGGGGGGLVVPFFVCKMSPWCFAFD